MRGTLRNSIFSELKRHALNNILKAKLYRFKDRSIETTTGRPIVAGLLTAPIGIGEGARTIYNALSDLGLSPSAFDLTDILQQGKPVIDFPFDSQDDGVGPVILHINPPEFLVALDVLKQAGLRGRRLICVWAWEQETAPQEWIDLSSWVDEVWASSRFIEDVFSKSLDCSVVYTGYPIALGAKNYFGPSGYSKIRRGKIFNVFTSFDINSGIERKNPAGAVAAFMEAFPDDQDVKLTIKVSNVANGYSIPQTWLNDPRIEILTSTLSGEEMYQRIHASDCVISLHYQFKTRGIRFRSKRSPDGKITVPHNGLPRH